MLSLTKIGIVRGQGMEQAMDTRRDFLKTMSVAGGLLTVSEGLLENKVHAEETAHANGKESMAVRTLEPGRLIPFLCLDATNRPDSVEVCAMPAKKGCRTRAAQESQSGVAG